MSTTVNEQTPAAAGYPGGRIDHAEDAHRDVLLAVQRALAAHWEVDSPRIAVVERGGIATVFVSTARSLDPSVRNDVRGAARAAMAPYVPLAPYTRVVFLHRAG
jgi:hypothetical protein